MKKNGIFFFQRIRISHCAILTTTSQRQRTKKKTENTQSREQATTREDKIWRKTRELEKKKPRPLLRDCKQSERGQLTGSSWAAEYETVTGRAGKTGM
jgi:hypothetical protein